MVIIDGQNIVTSNCHISDLQASRTRGVHGCARVRFRVAHDALPPLLEAPYRSHRPQNLFASFAVSFTFYGDVHRKLALPTLYFTVICLDANRNNKLDFQL